MVAIRADQELMAEFLVDNDIDLNHTCALIVSIIGLDKNNFSAYVSFQSILTYVLGAQKNRLIETVLLSHYNICFGLEIRFYALLSKC